MVRGRLIPRQSSCNGSSDIGGILGSGISEDTVVSLRERLETVASEKLGSFMHEPRASGGAVLAGHVTVKDEVSLTDVERMLGLLSDLEHDFDGLHIDVSDSLGRVGREELTGRFVIRPPAPPEVDGLLTDHLDLLEQGLDFPDAIVSTVYEGPNPAIPPFELTGWTTERLGAPQALEPRVLESIGEHWRPDSLRLTRQPTMDRLGEVLILEGDLRLTAADIARVSTLDLTLRDAQGNVLATDEQDIDQDVRRRCEVYIGVGVAAGRLAEVRMVELGVDAYVKQGHRILCWRPGGPAVTERIGDLESNLTIGVSRWPSHGICLSGDLGNRSRSFMATVEVELELLDGHGDVLDGGEIEVPMLAPGESRPFLLELPLDDDELQVVNTAVVAVQIVRRRREIACRLRLA